MQVSCAENHLSRTTDIHQETKNEFSKDTDDCWMIYFHQSHSDTVLHWLLQFLLMLYQELLEDYSFHDSTYSKKDHIWIKSDLSDDIQSYEEMYDRDFNTSSLWSDLWDYSWNQFIQLRQWWSSVSIWRWRNTTLDDLL